MERNRTGFSVGESATDSAYYLFAGFQRLAVESPNLRSAGLLTGLVQRLDGLSDCDGPCVGDSTPCDQADSARYDPDQLSRERAPTKRLGENGGKVPRA